MNAQQLGLVGLVLLVLGIAGCTTTPKVDFEVDPDLDPARYQSYYMLPIPTKFSSEHRLPDLVKTLAPLAEQSVDAVMVAKGYSPVESAETADLVILIHGDLTPKSQVLLDQSFKPSNVRPGATMDSTLHASNPGVVHRYDYDAGKLFVEVHDVAADRMVWVAWTERELKKLERPPVERVAGNITRLLENFPGRDSELGEN